MYVLLLVFLINFLTQWSQLQKAEKQLATEEDEWVVVKEEDAQQPTDATEKDDAAESPKAEKVVVTPVASPVVIPAKEPEPVDEEDDDAPTSQNKKAPLPPAFYEKNFAKDKATTASTTTTKTVVPVTTTTTIDRFMYTCPVPGCNFSLSFAKRHNPPLNADGQTVSDKEKWHKGLTNHAVRLRNHFSADHPKVAQDDWPAGFAYVRSGKRRAADTAASAKSAKKTRKGKA